MPDDPDRNVPSPPSSLFGRFPLPPLRPRWFWLLFVLAAMVGLLLLLNHSYLLFHLLTALSGLLLIYYALVEGALRIHYGSLFHDLSELNRSLDGELRRRVESDRRLRDANRELSLLYQAGQALHGTLHLDVLCHLILSLLASSRGGGFRRAMLFTVNTRTGMLQGMLGIDKTAAELMVPAEVGEGEWPPPRLDAATCSAQKVALFCREVRRRRLPLEAADNPLARASLEGRLVLTDASSDQSTGGKSLATSFALNSYVCVPLSAHDQPFAVLLVDLEGELSLPPAGRAHFVALFARQATAALENARLHQRLEAAHRELREVQEQLIQGERMAVLGEMSAQLAHELRNPLVAIGGFAQRLGRIELADARAGEYAAIIVREVRRLEEMLANVLSFSRHQGLTLEPCDLNIMIAEALELVAERRQGTGISLREDVAELPALAGDCRQLRQVVLNLLTNACQAMPNGGVLTVRAGSCRLRGEEGVAIEVEDTGGGIPAEILCNIFNPFFSTRPRGTGLGLSLAQRVVLQHRGQIEALNSADGACFIVRLPLHPPD